MSDVALIFLFIFGGAAFLGVEYLFLAYLEKKQREKKYNVYDLGIGGKKCSREK